MAILATMLFTQTTAAKLAADNSTTQLEREMDLNIEAEIVYNINNMLANLKAQAINTDVAKQLDIGAVQLQTNELVQNVGEKLPEFKFKVIIAD